MKSVQVLENTALDGACLKGEWAWLVAVYDGHLQWVAIGGGVYS